MSKPQGRGSAWPRTLLFNLFFFFKWLCRKPHCEKAEENSKHKNRLKTIKQPRQRVIILGPKIVIVDVVSRCISQLEKGEPVNKLDIGHRNRKYTLNS